MGADIALETFPITTGSRIPETFGRISCIYNNPCEDVAVNVLAPVSADPNAADNTECSDSS